MPGCGTAKAGAREGLGVLEVLRALADPKRFRIFCAPRSSERCVRDLVDGEGLAQPLVSHHLRVPERADLVTARQAHTYTMYAVDPAGLARARRALTSLLDADALSAVALPGSNSSPRLLPLTRVGGPGGPPQLSTTAGPSVAARARSGTVTTVSHSGQLGQVVRDHQHGCASPEPRHRRLHRLGGVGVERPGGLVQQKVGWLDGRAYDPAVHGAATRLEANVTEIPLAKSAA